ncbi:MAG: polyphosphate kinase 2 family protein [Bacteroidota bacterium]
MHVQIDTQPYRYDGSKAFVEKDCPTEVATLYENKKDYKKLLEEYREEIDELQNMMYAHDRYGLLIVFQAMDAAGKDGTIRHVMSGVNPHGVHVSSFKKPSTKELDHDFMWRTTREFPQRGRLGIFNRSYYEEVLVVRVHPEILLKYQRIPKEHTQNVEKVWQQRFEDIRNLELYAHRNGIHVVKFFLHLSKEEQRKRFLARIDTPSKNWKFSSGDVEERQYWEDYMRAYEDAINATAAPHAPWYVIPADNKKNMRLIVSSVVLQQLQAMDMHYPKMDPERLKDLDGFREQLQVES